MAQVTASRVWRALLASTARVASPTASGAHLATTALAEAKHGEPAAGLPTTAQGTSSTCTLPAVSG